jgi:hypothetical protein
MSVNVNTFWKIFEQTGSVAAYIIYRRAVLP